MSNVGIVVISHSFELVKGLQALLRQVQPAVPVAIAGGTEDGRIGTDVFAIKEAIELVYSEKGVVLFFDLGSALLNAEMALELLGNRENIKLVDAPIVEGSFVAVVESGCGSTLDEVQRAAEGVRGLNKLNLE
ncbi:dihydroxyacetone kinase phosphoryl donor subunit DhaM [Bacillus sp. JJ1562]|uniref:dihydroxyacetone kinase phosphoryl donor subunit DhaM n=1 Tax=Bacillus sp. JJ1562 TaxID=3122960 RepID=UPI0030036750